MRVSLSFSDCRINSTSASNRTCSGYRTMLTTIKSSYSTKMEKELSTNKQEIIKTDIQFKSKVQRKLKQYLLSHEKYDHLITQIAKFCI